MERARGFTRILSAIFFIAVWIGCNVFEPRTPEEPDVPRGEFKPPTSADIVIENFLNSIQERNSQHYIQNFVDTLFSERTYTFIPTQEAQNIYGNIFSDWTVTEERNYFENLISRVSSEGTFKAEFIGGTFESIQADSALYLADYIFTAEHDDESLPVIFRGSMRLALSMDNNNNWGIHRWEDFKKEDDISWSIAKGRFVN